MCGGGDHTRIRDIGCHKRLRVHQSGTTMWKICRYKQTFIHTISHVQKKRKNRVHVCIYVCMCICIREAFNLQPMMCVHHGSHPIKAETIKLVLLHPPPQIGEQKSQYLQKKITSAINK